MSEITGAKHIDPMHLAYMAGYFDGEGCVTISSNNSSVACSVTNTYPNVLNEMKEMFGGSVENKGSPKAQWRNAYRFCVYSQRACDMLEQLLPYLQEKRPQVELALEFQRTKDKAKRIELRDKIKALKHINHLTNNNERTTHNIQNNLH